MVGGGSRFGRVFARCAWGLAALLGLTLVAKSFVADVYRVHGDSMEPTLHGASENGGPPGGASGAAGRTGPAGRTGERVLVLYGGGGALERFDLVVLRRPGSEPPVVKRVAGLPGERVQIARGDLWIDGRRLGAGEPRPEPVLVFDDALARVEDEFHADWSGSGPWSRRGDALHLDARALEPGDERALLVLHEELTDGWMRSDGSVSAGSHQANDARLACQARAQANGGHIRLRIVEDGDAFEALIAPGPDGRAQASLHRYGRTPAETSELGSAEIEWEPERWHALAFENRDNHLRLEVDERAVLAHAYAANAAGATEEARAATETGAEPKAPPPGQGARVALGGEGTLVEFRALRVWRDQCWVPRGDFGVSEGLALGPGEYFVLGDNSARSSDSRLWGAVSAADVVGRPVCVVWPPPAWRWIRPRAEPPAGE